MNATLISLRSCQAILATFLLSLTAARADPPVGIDWHFEFAGGVPQKLVWQSRADQSYMVWLSPDLSVWFPVAGYPQQGSGGEMEHAFSAGTRGFFRIASAAAPPAGFAWIPGGWFQMGDQSDPAVGDFNELPVHSVYVSGFYMGRHEVTKALWDEVRAWGATHGYTDLPAGGGKAVDHPVQLISWHAAVKWCNARSEMEGLAPCYRVGSSVYRTGNSDDVNCDWSVGGYRLPSEAEWEKAARGGLSGRNFPWGDTINHSNANYRAGSPQSYDTAPYAGLTYHPSYNDGVFPYTSPVGSFAPNGYGLYDMVGNVGEWCWDWYSFYPSGSQTDPHGLDAGSRRMLRGGGWGFSAFKCRVAVRVDAITPENALYHYGFRVARSSVP